MFDAIAWSQPWYASVAQAAGVLATEGADFRASFSRRAAALGIRNHRGLPLTFIPQDDLPPGVAYEAHIAATGGVPTRDNLHDFFNGLVWLSFPRIKVRLNALQAAQIAQDGIGKSRGPARDAATIFDENAALLVVRESHEGRALVDALRGHRWHEAFIERRASFGRDAEVWLFGHALMEKLVAPRKAITAHTRVLWVDDGYWELEPGARRAHIDAAVAEQLLRDGLSTADFTPMQALGVPGWWPGQDEAFYADTSVFRPARQPARTA